MSTQEEYELGLKKETGCAVRMKKEQDQCRANRRHYKEQYRSTVFSAGQAGGRDGLARCVWSVNAPTHRESRHYYKAYETQYRI